MDEGNFEDLSSKIKAAWNARGNPVRSKLNTSQSKESISFNGSVVTPADLKHINSSVLTSKLMTEQNSAADIVGTFYQAGMINGRSLTFRTIDDVIAHPNTEDNIINEISLNYRLSRSRKVSVKYLANGNVEVAVTGPSNLVDELQRELRANIKKADQGYSALINVLVLGFRVRRMLISLSFFSMLAVTWFFGSSLYARVVGVNLDPKYLQHGMEYYKSVADAIESPDIKVKLNAILAGNLRDFVNANDFIARYQRLSLWLLWLAVLSAVAAWIIGKMRSCYPPVHYLIGHQATVFENMKRRRDLWLIGICLGFIVNVAAGLFMLSFGG